MPATHELGQFGLVGSYVHQMCWAVPKTLLSEHFQNTFLKGLLLLGYKKKHPSAFAFLRCVRQVSDRLAEMMDWFQILIVVTLQRYMINIWVYQLSPLSRSTVFAIVSPTPSCFWLAGEREVNWAQQKKRLYTEGFFAPRTLSTVSSVDIGSAKMHVLDTNFPRGTFPRDLQSSIHPSIFFLYGSRN